MMSFRRAGRSLVYWLSKCLSRAVPLGVFDLLTNFVVSRALGSRPYRGIVLIAYPPHPVDALGELVDALELIRRTDGRRFRRVEQHLKYIVLASWRSDRLGVYSSISRTCTVRKLSPAAKSNPWSVYAYAALIIHEATHALLDGMRFPNTRANKKRLERLCLWEEARFLSKFPGVDENLELAFGHAIRKPRTDR